MTDWMIRGGEVLCNGGFRQMDLPVADGLIGRPVGVSTDWDASGMLVLPGIVDIHGDGFERQIMPRPGVSFPLDVALADTDRQLIANGITTAFHGLTVSWEPGLRSIDNARDFVAAWQRIGPDLHADTRLHLRWETFALDAMDEIAGWFDLAPKPILAFNDHTTLTVEKDHVRGKLGQSAARAGLGLDDYLSLLDRVWARREEVPAAIRRLAERAAEKDLIVLAHDEASPEVRAAFRGLGAATSEFPLNVETASAAREAGEHTVLGAPNVLRGGSHTGALNAADAVAEGLCTILASDYYYPAPLHAAFRLVADGVTDLASAWRLISTHPAQAAGLPDRGVLEPGKRADIVVVDASGPEAPRVRAVFVAGRKVFEAA
ncbi:alpha-D-ribose 1-methylphosphonate 5-triphosphate diphosphatase [Minwuia sp.]|uniref:alpha-D-ribose 1-methylphosphonate 5-triphosphate diphosphatase n=1 Tax=Minwuia sp. TaxID=2493630 RepID=UPI003A90629C